jgi:hypothetical protein
LPPPANTIAYLIEITVTAAIAAGVCSWADSWRQGLVDCVADRGADGLDLLWGATRSTIANDIGERVDRLPSPTTKYS